MNPTQVRVPLSALLATLALCAACSLEATGMGPDDASATTVDDDARDAAPSEPTARPPVDAAIVEVPRPDAAAPVPDAEVPRDADVAVDATTPAPRDAGPESRRCGTRGGVRCGAEAFCNFEPDEACGALDRGGVCEARPDVCTNVYSPVCGCDGVTHPNACYAHGRGTSVKRSGRCGAEECQGLGGRVRTQANGGCGRPRAQWEITVNGQSALCCLGGGAPEPGPVTRTCGGVAGTACGAGQFCNYETGAGGLGCGLPDATGVCAPRPDACAQQSAPVCGCDRRTYPNACSAHAAGVAVLRDGSCDRGNGRP